MILEQMTTTEVEEALSECRTVILPFGVMEAHGSHLPLATDTYQAYDAAKRAARLVSVFVAPPIPYGMCRSAAGHPGTIGITGCTLRALTHDIVVSLYKTGFRNFILYSGHASTMQLAAMEEAGESLLESFADINYAVVSEFDITKQCELIETKGDLHAGEIETSRMLFIEPDLVRTENLPEEQYRQSAKPVLVRDTRRYWEGSTDGAPQKATKEKGERLAAMTAQYLADLVLKLNDFEPH